MSRLLTLNIALTPVVNYDDATNRYIIYYEQFPNALGTGLTEDDAEDNLIQAVNTMWKEHKKELRDTLLNNYISDAHSSTTIKIHK